MRKVSRGKSGRELAAGQGHFLLYIKQCPPNVRAHMQLLKPQCRLGAFEDVWLAVP